MYTHFVIKQQIQANSAVNHHNFYFIFSNKRMGSKDHKAVHHWWLKECIYQEYIFHIQCSKVHNHLI